MFGGAQDDTASAMQDNPAQVQPVDDGPVGGPSDTPVVDNAASPSAGYDPTALAANDTPASVSPVAPVDDNAPVGGSDDLMSIKQQALQQLSPLVGHLDQTPEEKFRTTMMMIQASDNQDLIKEAYSAAQAITDEKTRAQALLDIVNEINYFTSHQS